MSISLVFQFEAMSRGYEQLSRPMRQVVEHPIIPLIRAGFADTDRGWCPTRGYKLTGS